MLVVAVSRVDTTNSLEVLWMHLIILIWARSSSDIGFIWKTTHCTHSFARKAENFCETLICCLSNFDTYTHTHRSSHTQNHQRLHSFELSFYARTKNKQSCRVVNKLYCSVNVWRQRFQVFAIFPYFSPCETECCTWAAIESSSASTSTHIVSTRE